MNLLAHAVVHAAAEDLAALRQECGLPSSLFRHVEPQTVLGLVAVQRAMASSGLPADTWAEWAVLAAPQYLGQSAITESVEQFRQEGAWGVSPHLIPHRSLHSPSGTISMALGMRGPNYGVGGGPGAAGEVVLVASALLADGKLPGVWIVASEERCAVALAVTRLVLSTEYPVLRTPVDILSLFGVIP